MAEVVDHGGVCGLAFGMLLQLRQEFPYVFLNATWRGARLTGNLWRVQSSLQLHQPAVLALELPIARGECATAVRHRQQLLEQRMPPFFWLRCREASKRAKSLKTRRPPNSKGGLLPSVSVLRIKSA